MTIDGVVSIGMNQGIFEDLLDIDYWILSKEGKEDLINFLNMNKEEFISFLISTYAYDKNLAEYIYNVLINPNNLNFTSEEQKILKRFFNSLMNEYFSYELRSNYATLVYNDILKDNREDFTYYLMYGAYDREGANDLYDRLLEKFEGNTQYVEISLEEFRFIEGIL